MMLRRRVLQTVIGVVVAMAALVGMGTAASASPSSFTVRFVHGGGTGAIGAAATGTITWYNRSVGLTNVKVYAHALECSRLYVYAYAGSKNVDLEYTRTFCAPPDRGEWFPAADILLDGSAVSGGITEIDLYIVDEDHNGQGHVNCKRTASACA